MTAQAEGLGMRLLYISSPERAAQSRFAKCAVSVMAIPCLLFLQEINDSPALGKSPDIGLSQACFKVVMFVRQKAGHRQEAVKQPGHDHEYEINRARQARPRPNRGRLLLAKEARLV